MQRKVDLLLLVPEYISDKFYQYGEYAASYGKIYMNLGGDEWRTVDPTAIKTKRSNVVCVRTL